MCSKVGLSVFNFVTCTQQSYTAGCDRQGEDKTKNS